MYGKNQHFHSINKKSANVITVHFICTEWYCLIKKLLVFTHKTNSFLMKKLSFVHLNVMQPWCNVSVIQHKKNNFPILKKLFGPNKKVGIFKTLPVK